MRIVIVWIVTLLLFSVVTYAWYITTPLLARTLAVSEDILNNTGQTTPGGTQTYTLLDVLYLVWGPIVGIFILAWGVLSGTQRDVRSEYYR